jgi:hypothetical protein
MVRVAPLALLVVAACGGPRQVAVRILVPDLEGVETPLPGIVIVALPYDRDSILTLLEHRAATKRPHTQTLDSLFQAFRGPFVRFSRVAWQVEQLTRSRDSLVRRRAEAVPNSPGAKELDGRIRGLGDSLQRLQPEVERAKAALGAARDTLWPRIEAVRGETKHWEAATYAGYDTIVRTLTRDRLRQGVADTTDATGWATLRLTPGAWWITARSPDPQDPNSEWYWNVPATGDTIRLNPVMGRHLPRY